MWLQLNWIRPRIRQVARDLLRVNSRRLLVALGSANVGTDYEILKSFMHMFKAEFHRNVVRIQGNIV